MSVISLWEARALWAGARVSSATWAMVALDKGLPEPVLRPQAWPLKRAVSPNCCKLCRLN